MVQQQGHKGNNRRRRRPQSAQRRGRRGPRRRNTAAGNLSGVELLYFRYITFLEQHLHARRKYFELFYRADDRQLLKLQRKYEESMVRIDTFMDSLKEEERQELLKRISDNQLDTAYSTNHQLPPDSESVPANLSEDPHFLESQRVSSYKNDREETKGSMQDYYAYKGIDPTDSED